MLFFHKQKIAVLSMTKTGTSALEKALRPRASISMGFPPALKHMSYTRFMSGVHPLIESQCGLKREDYEVVVMMREPLDWLRSWYRYRNRENVRSRNATSGISFEDFAQAYLEPRPPAFAAVGRQIETFCEGGRIGVDRVFAYENFCAFTDFLSKRLGQSLDLARVNVSPERPAELSQETQARLVAHLAHPIALHGLLREDGLITPAHHAAIAEAFVEAEPPEAEKPAARGWGAIKKWTSRGWSSRW